jgi:hypothetical protein
MSDIQKYKFTLNKDYLKEIIDALKDLNKIDAMIKIKIDTDDVLFYSKAGLHNNIHALKSFIFPIENFIINKDKEYLTKDFIILNAKVFLENLTIMLNRDQAITGLFQYKDKDKIISTLNLSDGALKFNFITGDYKQIKDISKLDIEQKMNPSLANFTFNLTKDQFNEIKKLTTLNKSEVASIRVKSGKLEFFDKRWSYHVADLPNVDDEEWGFNNKYLKSINVVDNIDIHMFDQFLLVKEDNIALMIGLELSAL